MTTQPTIEERQAFLDWYDQHQPDWDVVVGRWYFGKYVWGIHSEPFKAIYDAEEFNPSNTEWWAITLLATVYINGFLDGVEQVRTMVDKFTPPVKPFRTYGRNTSFSEKVEPDPD